MRTHISTLLSGLKDRTSIKVLVWVPGIQAVSGPSDMADMAVSVKTLPVVHDRSPQRHINKNILASEASGSRNSPKVLTQFSLNHLARHSSDCFHCQTDYPPWDGRMGTEMPSQMNSHWRRDTQRSLWNEISLAWLGLMSPVSQSLGPEDGMFYIHLGPVSM